MFSPQQGCRTRTIGVWKDWAVPRLTLAPAYLVFMHILALTTTIQEKHHFFIQHFQLCQKHIHTCIVYLRPFFFYKILTFKTLKVIKSQCFQPTHGTNVSFTRGVNFSAHKLVTLIDIHYLNVPVCSTYMLRNVIFGLLSLIFLLTLSPPSLPARLQAD